MQLVIAAVGHKMPGWIEKGFEEYTKRMPNDCRIILKEIKPVERSGSKTAETVMALERTKIEAALPKGAFIVALDERGKDLSTMQLSQHLTKWQQDGRDIAFVIGGADGLDTNFAVDISSTDIRSMLQLGQKPEDLLPQAVLDYIAQHHLYQSQP